jgi:enamine deaminase RidA (YjgF/YER057c/UK114 family)
MERLRISSNAQWESVVGYSRAVRVGPHIYVAGTTGIDESGNVVSGAQAQATRAFQIIEQALNKAGASLRDVVRTRIFVTDITQWESIGRVHGEIFRDIRPAATVVEVKQLVKPEMLVEIEADAFVSNPS